MWHKDIISGFFFCLCFLCVLQLQNGYVKSAQWRDVMTFSWMLYTKSKRPTICWVPAWRHLIPIPLMRHYRWNASRHHSPPKLALGLSDFSFHFNVFRNNTCITALCDASAPSWYFHYLREVWLNKGDLASVTFSISLWRQTGKGSQSADWTWGGRGGIVKVGVVWGSSPDTVVLAWTPH